MESNRFYPHRYDGADAQLIFSQGRILPDAEIHNTPVGEAMRVLARVVGGCALHSHCYEVQRPDFEHAKNVILDGVAKHKGIVSKQLSSKPTVLHP